MILLSLSRVWLGFCKNFNANESCHDFVRSLVEFILPSISLVFSCESPRYLVLSDQDFNAVYGNKSY